MLVVCLTKVRYTTAMEAAHSRHRNRQQNKTNNNKMPRARAYSELRSCVTVEVAVLGSPSLISLVFEDVKKHERSDSLSVPQKSLKRR